MEGRFIFCCFSSLQVKITPEEGFLLWAITYYICITHFVQIKLLFLWAKKKKSNQTEKNRFPHQIEIVTTFFKQSLYILLILCQHKYSLWLVIAYTFSKVSIVKYHCFLFQRYFSTSYFVDLIIIRWLFPLCLRWGLWPCYIALFRNNM